MNQNGWTPRLEPFPSLFPTSILPAKCPAGHLGERLPPRRLKTCSVVLIHLLEDVTSAKFPNLLLSLW